MLALPLGVLLVFAGCEAGPIDGPEDGIGFGEAGDLDEGQLEGDGDNDQGHDDNGEESGGSTSCQAIVETLEITDATERASVDCVEEVTGDLKIGPTTSLKDLQWLTKLRHVGGTLYVVGNLGLESLSGLEQLEDVDWIHLRRNEELAELGGLAGLGYVDRITITDNDSLVDLDGFPEGLSPSLLEVSNNDGLLTLSGLPVFLSPGDGPFEIEVEDNPVLADLHGLSDCCSQQQVALTVTQNPTLDDLEGLEGFDRIQTLRLHDNVGLHDFGGLSNVTDIDTLIVDFDRCLADNTPTMVNFAGADSLARVGFLQVEWVSSLTSFVGLAELSDTDKLFVRNNELLPWSAVLDLADDTGPMTTDLCGGVGGPECVNEPCPRL